jgi:C4-dicarboxylate-specific signal transduction histidine kinase
VIASFYLIGLTANLFTELLDKRTVELEETKIKLEEERSSLEIKVKARTKQLEENAKSLEEKVNLRTKEIQNKMMELEKFNKLAIGREIKMIELKKKLQAIERE